MRAKRLLAKYAPMRWAEDQKGDESSAISGDALGGAARRCRDCPWRHTRRIVAANRGGRDHQSRRQDTTLLLPRRWSSGGAWGRGVEKGIFVFVIRGGGEESSP